MSAARVDEMLATYVHRVAAELPIRMRSRVSLELASLLRQDLRASAEAAGRAPDEALALGVITAFGHPREVADRYLPEGAGGTSSLTLSAILGGVILLAAGTALLDRGTASGPAAFPLWWLGPAVVLFSLKNWLSQRRPDPHWASGGFDRVSRGSMIALVLAIAVSIILFGEGPHIFSWLTGGKPLAASLRFDSGFRSSRMPWLFGVWIGQAIMITVVAIRGSWSLRLQRIHLALGATIVALLAWYHAGGPVMAQPTSDATVKMGIAIIASFLLLDVAVRFYRNAGQVSGARLRAALNG